MNIKQVEAIHKPLQIRGDLNARKQTQCILNARWLERAKPNLNDFDGYYGGARVQIAISHKKI